MHWADLLTNHGSVAVNTAQPLVLTEPEFPTGSCPYLYVWDGRRHRFVTDLLGASPRRACASPTIDSSRPIAKSFITIGDESNVQPRDKQLCAAGHG